MEKGIGIAGIAGRMGRLLAEEVTAAGAKLVGGIDRPDVKADAKLFADIAALAAASDVVLDFTHASTAAAHGKALAAAGTAWVLGTTGLSAADEAVVAETAKQVAVVYAPNFSAGVNLMLALAERMAAALPAEQYDAEIVEMHHHFKKDAPSGTALGLANALAKGRGVNLKDVACYGREGMTGERPSGQIGIHAVRGGDVVGDHVVMFATDGERVEITHRASSRECFANGALKAAAWLPGRKPGLYNMRNVLNLD